MKNKRRSGEAVAAQHRNAGAMKHRNTPRGGARNTQSEYWTEIEDMEHNYAQTVERRGPQATALDIMQAISYLDIGETARKAGDEYGMRIFYAKARKLLLGCLGVHDAA